ncbi:hypothetical protein EVJ58_g9564 [Rhodofomes roseus]|uniref:Ubinuclein middle domain-containing protein n=1 Tax=Rhodofomes roseus TaxID=34475 RepID=A0A4Y9XSE8_9APHY|nr:hypothetical protein EVJ58_g9564 [Rhodofomes roseus]
MYPSAVEHVAIGRQLSPRFYTTILLYPDGQSTRQVASSSPQTGRKVARPVRAPCGNRLPLTWIAAPAPASTAMILNAPEGQGALVLQIKARTATVWLIHRSKTGAPDQVPPLPRDMRLSRASPDANVRLGRSIALAPIDLGCEGRRRTVGRTHGHGTRIERGGWVHSTPVDRRFVGEWELARKLLRDSHMVRASADGLPECLRCAISPVATPLLVSAPAGPLPPPLSNALRGSALSPTSGRLNRLCTPPPTSCEDARSCCAPPCCPADAKGGDHACARAHVQHEGAAGDQPHKDPVQAGAPCKGPVVRADGPHEGERDLAHTHPVAAPAPGGSYGGRPAVASREAQRERREQQRGRQRGRWQRAQEEAEKVLRHARPLIDDSELAQDERTFFAQTKHDDETAAQSGAAVRDAHPPGKKYRLADTMKAIIWQLVCLSNEVVRLENGKNILENSNQVVSDQGVRKTLHQKIPHALLGLVSFMKKKYAKEVIENEA